MKGPKLITLREHGVDRMRCLAPRRWGMPVPGAASRLLAIRTHSQERGRSVVDPYEEKVKRKALKQGPLQQHAAAAQPAPSSPLQAQCTAAPSAVAAAGMLVHGLASSPPAVAASLDPSLALHSPLHISYGPPNDLLPHLIQHQQQLQEEAAAAQAASAANSEAGTVFQGGVGAVIAEVRETSEQLLQHAAAQAGAVRGDVEDTMTAVQQALGQSVQGAAQVVSQANSQLPASAASAYSQGVATMHQLASSLSVSMADWPVSPQVIQVASYCAAASAVVLLLRGGLTTTPPPASPPASTRTATGAGTNTTASSSRRDTSATSVPMRTLASTAVTRDLSSWGKPQQTTNQQHLSAASSAPAATSSIITTHAASPSPRPDVFGMAAGPQPEMGMNPVQAAWHHFRSGAVARAFTPTPMRGSTIARDDISNRDSGRSATGEPMELRSLRSSLKEQLAAVCEALGPLLSVVPAGDEVRPHADELVMQLERVAPSRRSAHSTAATRVQAPVPLFDASLLGDWQLMYASNSSHEPQQPAAPGSPSAATITTASGNTIPNSRTADPHVYATRSTGLSKSASSTGRSTGRTAAGSTMGNAAPQTANLSAALRSGVTNSPALQAGTSSGGVLGVLLHLVAALPMGCGLQHVDQRLELEEGQTGRHPQLNVTNSATLSLGPLGVWRVETRGYWQQEREDTTPGTPHSSRPWRAWFESLALQPIELLGQNTQATLPQVVVALPPQLSGTSDWVTTYVDDNTRITRGAGAVFLFKRVSSKPHSGSLNQASGAARSGLYNTGAYA